MGPELKMKNESEKAKRWTLNDRVEVGKQRKM